ncbi:MAG: hypothetical protein WDO73_28785 [Ignavibacteriota bacterium]
MNRAPSVFILRSFTLAAICGLAVWNGWSKDEKQASAHPTRHKVIPRKTSAGNAALAKVGRTAQTGGPADPQDR